ncbi:chromosome segregation protein [Pedobacter sp. UYP30]|uniref:chromosome segregation protein SMC n=1 Tax=Pedobacter sp. UYP30 TaxID=1756400 RepID=UPI00339746F8
MQLTKLEIKGFKSFGDKVIINFNVGITAIVGPNGCGKSNVIDAMRWVLGEQSTKALRSEKMENIIFNGTKTRKAAQLAEVSLSFDNTKNILPTEYSQVTVTRKLYRTGESEYRLNDVQCRLKDITDLFLDTGIGSDSYSIIELKMVDEIINNKEHSRRSLFEEASGISKYKLRKKQTFGKLKDTEADLERVDDLLFEIEKNLKTLENQAKKTERYFKLKEQYKAHSIKLATHRISFFRNDLQQLESQEAKQLAARTALSTSIDTNEAALQALKLESINQEKNLSVQQKATNEFVAKIRTYESEKKVKNEQMRFLQEKEQRLSTEVETDKNQLNHVKYNVKRLNEELLVEHEKLTKHDTDLADLKQQLDKLRAQQQIEKNQIDEFLRTTASLEKQVYEAQKEIDILNIQKDALKQESSRTTVDTEGKTKEIAAFADALKNIDAQILTKTENVNALIEREEILKRNRDEAETTLEIIRDKLQKENRNKDAKQNEYNLTKSLVDSLEGFPESIKYLKKHAILAKKAFLLSDVLFCKEDYRVALENYLEPVMNHYVVDEYNDAVLAINALNDASKGRANFFVLEKLTESKTNYPAKDGLVAALSVVEVDEKYRPLAELLLQNVFVVDGSQEDLFKNPENEGVTILSKNGKYSKTKFTLSGGSVGLFEGKRIGRAKNLENLNKEIKAQEKTVDAHDQEITLLQTRINQVKNDTKEREIIGLKETLNKLNSEQISLKTRSDQYQEFILTTQNREKDIVNRITLIEKTLTAKLPALIVVQQKQQETHGLLQHKQLAYQEIAEQVITLASKFNEDNLKFHQQKNKHAGVQKDLEYRFAQEENLNKRLTQNQTALNEAKLSIKNTVQHTDLGDEELAAMYQQREETEAGLAEAEKTYFNSKGNINEAETDITALRKNREQNEFLLTEIKDKKNTLKLELNSLKERLSVEFNLDIKDLLEGGNETKDQRAKTKDQSKKEVETEVESEFELRQKVEKLKRQLDDFGAINPMALEGYKEMDERYTFIKSQKTDLIAAKTNLLQTIQEIDNTAKEKFMEAFLRAREHFITVFRSLFNEEDSCDLILSDVDRPLEADIEIIAKPKGKRPLSINQLSGGEKTLTATALLFSLYLLKPAPFCIFDEVDAPLDDTNIDKFNNIIRKFSNQSQFIVVSHNKKTIASTDIIYGVTMVEQGVSRVVAVDMREVA